MGVTKARRRFSWLLVVAGLVTALALVEALIAIFGGSSPSTSSALAKNPNLDPGTVVSGSAPGFTLTDQFGRRVSLQSLRGKAVILAFNDAECTTICPMTTTAMLDAKAMLGSAGSRVELLGIDANPTATAVRDVWAYSEVHGMLRQWQFLTGSLPELKRIWKAYGIEVDIERGMIDHTPALYVIDPQGRLRKLYETQQSYAAVGQLGQLLAQEVSSVLPDHPAVHGKFTYNEISGISPTRSVNVPRAGGGSVRLGPGAPRLFLFFASWDREVTNLGGQLEALNRYQSSAASAHLPALTAVDEDSVEPSSSAITSFLGGLPQPLSYPVAIDASGRIADGYEVTDEPWLMLTSSSGQILWYWDVSTSGWLSRSALISHIKDALARAPNAASSAATVARELSGSPAPLAAVHAQAGQVLGSVGALKARVRALRGYPIVINVWASWCVPCREEFNLFASASAAYGRRVAFLGADYDDSLGDARSFLGQHSVSYPSYQASNGQLSFLLPGGVQATPTTIFVSPSGKVAYVHTGQYDAQGSLDGDIGTYALAG
jgi:cytochrome oxidase Cu insertion factor (SCO1/SenC/PrrC family)/thiol-disulfide isomerase/thioredoxin